MLLSVMTLFVAQRVNAPSDGVRVEFGDLNSIYQPDGLVVVPYETNSPFRRNDIVVAVAGHSMLEWANRIGDASEARPLWQDGGTIEYVVRRGEAQITLPITLGDFPVSAWFAEYWGNILPALLMFGIGAYVFARRPYERAAQLLFLTTTCLLTLVVIQWLSLSIQEFIEGLAYVIPRSIIIVIYHCMWSTLLWFILIFPKPQPWLIRARWIVPLLYLLPLPIFLFYLGITFYLEPNRILWHGDWVTVSDRIALGYGVACVIALWLSYRNARRDPIARLQARWAVSGFVLSLLLIVTLNMLPKNILGAPILDRRELGFLLLPIPIGLGVAILRYRLFEIDRLINRALVYGALTVFVVSVYIFVVGYLGSLIHTAENNHTRADLFFSLLATGAIALLFQPLRERIQRVVNRLMYGERDEPYRVLAHLGQRLEATLASNDVLPTIVETIATTLKLPYVAIALKDVSREMNDEAGVTASFGNLSSMSRPALLERFPLIYQHETIGELIVALRDGEDTLASADQNLLETIAEQAAVAAHAARVTVELQTSRERLVTAREEERRRIRRDLHDGLGPALASITLKLDATRNLLPPNAEASAQLLKELKGQTQGAIADIRRLVYDLRPPALDELGLAGALREYATRVRSDELEISVQVSEPLPPLTAALEVATYRIITEALTNVHRHANARHCFVAVGVNGDLELEIQDDGAGLPKTYHAGVGLTSMRERAAELGGTCVIENAAGGGTRVRAILPMARDL